MENEIEQTNLDKNQILNNISLAKKEEQLIRLYVSDEISITDLEKETIYPDKILKLEESLILKLFTKGLPKNLTFTDDSLLHAYGRTLSGTTILKLSSLGYIPHNKAILISNKHSLPITEPSLAIEPKELLDFYSADILANMATNNEITPEFSRNYNENLISILSDEEKDEHFSKLVEETD